MIPGRKRREAKKFWAHNAWMEAKMRESAATSPLYGLAGWTGLRMAGRWTFTEAWEAETISLQHGDPHDATATKVLVATSREVPAKLVEKLRFEHAPAPAMRRNPGPAPTGEIEIVVDGHPRVFELWENGDRWQAASQLDERRAIVLDAFRADPAEIALVRVHDFESCLTDRRNWIKTHYDRN